MSNFYEIEKKLNFADFLISQGDSGSYSSAAFKHVLTASTMLIQELTDLDDSSAKSPQIVAKTLKRFEESKAGEFSKFYINILKLASRPEVPVTEVEHLIRKTRDFMKWVEDQRVA
ncbi:hypothetical protein HN924_03615 [Candidatus Woesearchaeota archaeon]|jgi:hypothetical protein|nr:hypothetical protein [Candidatus Woesearchaeota archaeon]MBT7063028.1 hypothetical protein [Candidatus Woesearchaeota archaeon]MBT7402497.1 hypothetical protein [Candidatus Woesearchaeota archaeon]